MSGSGKLKDKGVQIQQKLAKSKSSFLTVSVEENKDKNKTLET